MVGARRANGAACALLGRRRRPRRAAACCQRCIWPGQPTCDCGATVAPAHRLNLNITGCGPRGASRRSDFVLRPFGGSAGRGFGGSAERRGEKMCDAIRERPEGGKMCDAIRERPEGEKMCDAIRERPERGEERREDELRNSGATGARRGEERRRASGQSLVCRGGSAPRSL